VGHLNVPNSSYHPAAGWSTGEGRKLEALAVVPAGLVSTGVELAG
jgi:hypothetical protein